MAFKMKGHTLPGPNQRKPSPAKLAFLIPLAVAAGKAIAKGAVVAGKGAAIAGKAIGKGAAVAGKAVGKGAVAAGKAVGKGATAVGKAVGKGAKAVGKGAKTVGKATKKIAAKKIGETTVGELAGQAVIGTGISKAMSAGGKQKQKSQEKMAAAQQSKIDALKMQQGAFGGGAGTTDRDRLV